MGTDSSTAETSTVATDAGRTAETPATEPSLAFMSRGADTEIQSRAPERAAADSGRSTSESGRKTDVDGHRADVAADLGGDGTKSDLTDVGAAPADDQPGEANTDIDAVDDDVDGDAPGPEVALVGDQPLASIDHDENAIDEEGPRDPLDALSPEDRKELIATLKADSNPKAVLPEAIAERILSGGPAGTTIKVAGPGGAGADVTFVDGNGKVVDAREAKAMESVNPRTGAGNIRTAAKQLGYNGTVFIQLPEEASPEDGRRIVREFQGDRSDGQLSAYKDVGVVFLNSARGPIGQYAVVERLGGGWRTEST